MDYVNIGKEFVGSLTNNELQHSQRKHKVLTFSEAPTTYTYNGVVYKKYPDDQTGVTKGQVGYINKEKRLRITLAYGIKEPYLNKLIVLGGATRWVKPRFITTEVYK